MIETKNFQIDFLRDKIFLEYVVLRKHFDLLIQIFKI